MKYKLSFIIICLSLLFFSVHRALAANFSVQFNGIDQRVIAQGNVPALGDVFTCEVFFKWTNRGSQVAQGILERALWNTQEWGLYIYSQTGRIQAVVSYDGLHGSTNSTTLGAGTNHLDLIPSNNWHHAALVGEGTGKNLSLYIDGVLVDSALQVGTPLLKIDAGSGRVPAFSIGGLDGSSVGATHMPFFGEIDEVRLSNVARYMGSTYQIPVSEFIVDAKTTGLWHFSEGTGSNIVDSSNLKNNGTFFTQDTVTNALWTPGYPYNASHCLPLGDVDCSGKVNSLDGAIVISMFGKTNPPDDISKGDLDDSQTVDVMDLLIYLSHYGATN